MIEPIKDRLLIKPDSPEQVSAGGIVLPEVATESPYTGEVIAVGALVKEVKPGDQVLYSRYAGTEITDEGEELIILREPDVMAVKH